MKFSELRVGQRIEDTLYNSEHQKGHNNWGTGRIMEILKTRFKVQFSNKNANHSGDGLVTYDKSHAQFVRLVKRKRKA